MRTLDLSAAAMAGEYEILIPENRKNQTWKTVLPIPVNPVCHEAKHMTEIECQQSEQISVESEAEFRCGHPVSWLRRSAQQNFVHIGYHCCQALLGGKDGP